MKTRIEFAVLLVITLVGLSLSLWGIIT